MQDAVCGSSTGRDAQQKCRRIDRDELAVLFQEERDLHFCGVTAGVVHRTGEGIIIDLGVLGLSRLQDEQIAGPHDLFRGQIIRGRGQ